MATKLDKIDRKILFELGKNSRLSETKLAKMINRSKSTAKYRIKQLQKKGVIERFNVWIDPTKLGFQVFKLYMKIINKPNRKKEFIEYVKNEKRLFWLGIGDGAFDIGVTFFGKDTKDYYEFEKEFISKFRDIIISKKTGTIVDVFHTPLNFLVDKKEKEMNFMFYPIQDNKLDSVEKQILNLLLSNSRRSLVELAAATKTSTDVVKSRIKKMEKLQIINSYGLSFNYSKIGYEYFKTFIFLKHSKTSEDKKLLEFAKNHPNVLRGVRMVGPWEMEFEIMIENYEKYVALLNSIKEQFSDLIIDTQTTIMSEDYVFPCKEIVI
jgi:Lrp/AsnC family transcriptional regulator, leucine-responsive regulatory protein